MLPGVMHLAVTLLATVVQSFRRHVIGTVHLPSCLYVDVKLPSPTVGYGKGCVTSSSTAVSGTVVHSATGSSLAPEAYMYVVHITITDACPRNSEEFC